MQHSHCLFFTALLPKSYCARHKEPANDSSLVDVPPAQSAKVTPPAPELVAWLASAWDALLEGPRTEAALLLDVCANAGTAPAAAIAADKIASIVIFLFIFVPFGEKLFISCFTLFCRAIWYMFMG